MILCAARYSATSRGAFSMTTVRSPTQITPSSAMSTAPNRIKASVPMRTAARTTAVAATQALGSTRGVPPCRRQAGITKNVGPHTLRQAFITDAQVSGIASDASLGSSREHALPASQRAALRRPQPAGTPRGCGDLGLHGPPGSDATILRVGHIFPVDARSACADVPSRPRGAGASSSPARCRGGGQAGPQAERGEVRGIHQSAGSRSPA